MIVTYKLFEAFANLFKCGNVSRDFFNEKYMGESIYRNSLRKMYDKMYGTRHNYELLVKYDVSEKILNEDEFSSIKEFFAEIHDVNCDTFKKFKDFITDKMHGKLIDPDRFLDMRLAYWDENDGNDFCFSYIDDKEIIINILNAHKWKEISVPADKYPTKILETFGSTEDLRIFCNTGRGYAFLGYREGNLFLDIDPKTCL